MPLGPKSSWDIFFLCCAFPPHYNCPNPRHVPTTSLVSSSEPHLGAPQSVQSPDGAFTLFFRLNISPNFWPACNVKLNLLTWNHWKEILLLHWHSPLTLRWPRSRIFSAGKEKSVCVIIRVAAHANAALNIKLYDPGLATVGSVRFWPQTEPTETIKNLTDSLVNFQI